MKRTTIIIIAVVAVVAGGGGLVYVLTRGDSKESDGAARSSNSTSEDKNASSDTAPTSPTEASLTIVFTNDGFDKANYAVKAGSVVTVKNESDMDVQFSSGNHPTHQEDPEINMAVLAPGDSGTFTPTIKGSHSFHDHLNDQYTGTLVVE